MFHCLGAGECFTASEQESVSLPQSRRVFHCLRAGECFTAGEVKCSQQERVHHGRYVVKCTLWNYVTKVCSRSLCIRK